MWEKMLVVSITFGGVLLFDGFALRGKLSARDKLVYGTLIVLSLYTGIEIVVNKDWLTYLDVVNMVFGKAAKAMEQLLKVDWES